MDKMPGRRIEARLRFVTEREGRRHERGREWFRFDRHADGSIVFRAASESDEPPVTRDVLYTLEPDFRPREAFARLQVGGRHIGSGWFRFEPGQATAELWSAEHGRSALALRIDGRVGSFCTHPVSTDALIFAAYDHANPERRQLAPNVFSSSPDPFGRTGPTLHAERLVLEYVGREALQTAVGPFETDHYRLGNAGLEGPMLQDVWCLAGTCVLVHSRAGGVFGTSYELEAFEVGGTSGIGPPGGAPHA